MAPCPNAARPGRRLVSRDCRHFAAEPLSGAAFNWLAAQVRLLRKARKAPRSRVTLCLHELLPAPATEPVDRSTRFADLSKHEDDLVKEGKHVLVAHSMEPKAGCDFLTTAASFAAETSTGTLIEGSTTDDSTKAEDALVCQALDQTSRYANLCLQEEDLLKDGRHVLVAYSMKPKTGCDYLATAAQFAAVSSTGTIDKGNMTDEFTEAEDALIYHIDPEAEEMKIAFPNRLFDWNIFEGRATMCSIMTLPGGCNQDMHDVEYSKINDIYFPPEFLRLLDSPSSSIIHLWRILGRDTSDGGMDVGTISEPKLGLRPRVAGETCSTFWQGGDLIKNDEPQGNLVLHQMNECIPEVVKATREKSEKCVQVTLNWQETNEQLGKLLCNGMNMGSGKEVLKEKNERVCSELCDGMNSEQAKDEQGRCELCDGMNSEQAKDEQGRCELCDGMNSEQLKDEQGCCELCDGMNMEQAKDEQGCCELCDGTSKGSEEAKNEQVCGELFDGMSMSMGGRAKNEQACSELFDCMNVGSGRARNEQGRNELCDGMNVGSGTVNDVNEHEPEKVQETENGQEKAKTMENKQKKAKPAENEQEKKKAKPAENEQEKKKAEETESEHEQETAKETENKHQKVRAKEKENDEERKKARETEDDHEKSKETENKHEKVSAKEKESDENEQKENDGNEQERKEARETEDDHEKTKETENKHKREQAQKEKQKKKKKPKETEDGKNEHKKARETENEQEKAQEKGSEHEKAKAEETENDNERAKETENKHKREQAKKGKQKKKKKLKETADGKNEHKKAKETEIEQEKAREAEDEKVGAKEKENGKREQEKEKARETENEHEKEKVTENDEKEQEKEVEEGENEHEEAKETENEHERMKAKETENEHEKVTETENTAEHFSEKEEEKERRDQEKEKDATTGLFGDQASEAVSMISSCVSRWWVWRPFLPRRAAGWLENLPGEIRIVLAGGTGKWRLHDFGQVLAELEFATATLSRLQAALRLHEITGPHWMGARLQLGRLGISFSEDESMVVMHSFASWDPGTASKSFLEYLQALRFTALA